MQPASRRKREREERELTEYSLRRVCYLIDSRHGPQKTDTEIMHLFDECSTPFQVAFPPALLFSIFFTLMGWQLILTKVDKLKKQEAQELQKMMYEEALRHPTCYPQVLAVSGKENIAIPDLRASIVAASGIKMSFTPKSKILEKERRKLVEEQAAAHEEPPVKKAHRLVV
jgi:GTP-binding protein EngB required for normal cell division